MHSWPIRLALGASLALLLPALGLTAPPLPQTPAPARLVAARPYVADAPLGHDWDHSQPPSRRGWLVVIDADPGLSAIRQVAEPNLYVGGHLATRAGRPRQDGRAVYLVAADVDLASEPLFFGEAKLPEQVSEDDAASQVELARAARLPAPRAAEVAAALAAGGAEVEIATFADLAPARADLAARFLSPGTQGQP